MEKFKTVFTFMVKKIIRALGLLLFILHKKQRPIFLFLGRRLGDIVFYLIRKRRLVVIANIIGTIGSTWPREKVLDIARKSYQNLALNLLEFLTSPYQTKEYINSFFHSQGMEVYKPLLETQKGSILLTCHIGNWETFGAWLCLNGYPLHAMNKRQKGIFAGLVIEYREMCNIKLVYKGSFLKGALKCLKSGGILGMIADQGGGKVVDFMGRPTSMPYGPSTFARKFKCPVIPTFSHRLENGDHEVIALPPIEIDITKDLEKDNLVNTIRCTKAIEKYITEHPEDWFWFHKMWKDLLVPFGDRKL